jgi:hypothetical protein
MLWLYCLLLLWSPHQYENYFPTATTITTRVLEFASPNLQSPEFV